MPTYTYACTECGNRFDIQQSFSDSSLTECPKCTGRLRKVFSAVGVVFKGSGFYRTDSRGSGGELVGSKDGAAKDGSAKDGAAKDGAAKDGAAAVDSGGKDKKTADAATKTTSADSGSSSSGSSPIATPAV